MEGLFHTSKLYRILSYDIVFEEGVTLALYNCKGQQPGNVSPSTLPYKRASDMRRDSPERQRKCTQNIGTQSHISVPEE